MSKLHVFNDAALTAQDQENAQGQWGNYGGSTIYSFGSLKGLNLGGSKSFNFGGSKVTTGTKRVSVVSVKGADGKDGKDGASFNSSKSFNFGGSKSFNFGNSKSFSFGGSKSFGGFKGFSLGKWGW